MEESRLKTLRKKKGFSQTKVQMETGIDQSDYSKMEQGKRYPNKDQLISLSRLFETSIDYIVGNTDEPTPYPRSTSGEAKKE